MEDLIHDMLYEKSDDFNQGLNLEIELKIEKLQLERDLSQISKLRLFNKEIIPSMENPYDNSYVINMPNNKLFIRKIYMDLEFKNEFDELDDKDLLMMISNCYFELCGKSESLNYIIFNRNLSMINLKNIIMKESLYITETKLRFELFDFTLMNFTTNQIEKLKIWLSSDIFHDKFKISINLTCEPLITDYVYKPFNYISRKTIEWGFYNNNDNKYEIGNYCYNIDDSTYSIGMILKIENDLSEIDPPDELNKITFYSSTSKPEKNISFDLNEFTQINLLNTKYIFLIFDDNYRTEEYQNYLLSGFIPNQSIMKIKALQFLSSYDIDVYKDIFNHDDCSYYKLHFLHDNISSKICYSLTRYFLYLNSL